jgi:hypothetical protein
MPTLAQRSMPGLAHLMPVLTDAGPERSDAGRRPEGSEVSNQDWYYGGLTPGTLSTLYSHSALRVTSRVSLL